MVNAHNELTLMWKKAQKSGKSNSNGPPCSSSPQQNTLEQKFWIVLPSLRHEHECKAVKQGFKL